MHKIPFRWGFAPDPAIKKTYSAPPDPLVGFYGNCF